VYIFFQSTRVAFIDYKKGDVVNFIKILQSKIDDLLPKTFVTDCFPLGVTGELNDVVFGEEVIHEHICRRLYFKPYLNKIRVNLKWESVYACEALDRFQLDFFKIHSKEIENINLSSPAHLSSIQEVDGSWLIVHSGPKEEVLKLIDFAKKQAVKIDKKPLFKVVTFADIDGAISTNDLIPLFIKAERIFIGGGFNLIHETESFRSKTIALPFKRKYDNQVLRIKRAYSP
tara:strand:- start:144 stop:833 length:690 start_codon:yes stop_codon:yes gene_type:complete